MFRRDPLKPEVPIPSVIMALFLGAGLGLVVLVLVEMETKWLVYGVIVIPFLVVFLATSDKERLLWTLYILSLQVYVSFRILHGRAGGTGLEFPLAFVVAVALVSWYLVSGEAEKLRPIQFGGPLATPIVLLFCATALSLVFTSERFVGLTALLMQLQFYFMYLIGLNLVTSKKQIDRIVTLLVIVLTLQSVLYCAQAYLGFTFRLTGETFQQGVRAGGTVGSTSAIFAAFILPIFMIAIARFMSSTASTKDRIYLIVSIALAITAFILTLRRGAWGGFAVGFVWLLFLGHRRKALSRPWLVTGAVLVGALVLLTPVIATMVDSIRTGNPLTDAYSERLKLMRMAWEVIKAHPITGVGPGAYAYSYKHYLTPELMEGWTFTVHNQYLLMGAELGIPGMFAFILFLIAGIRLSVRVSTASDPNLQALGLGASAGVVAYCFALFWEPLSHFSPNALLWFLIGLIGSADSLRQRAEWDGEQNNGEGNTSTKRP